MRYMPLFSSFSALQSFLHAQRDTKPVVFVPTMGALHEGHLSLFQQAKTMGTVVGSIFVNPTQFTNAEDFEKYPRNLLADEEKLETMGIDALFVPEESEVYGFSIPQELENVALPPLFSTLEGAARPGHFEGVFQVLFRFFSQIRPDMVIFGQKDFQQTLLVRWLCEHYFPEITVCIAPIARESHGLARSSRNERLTPTDRNDASVLYHAISAVQQSFITGENRASVLETMGKEILQNHPNISAVHYFTIANAHTLEPKSIAEKGDILLLSVHYTGIHLIDNAFL